MCGSGPAHTVKRLGNDQRQRLHTISQKWRRQTEAGFEHLAVRAHAVKTEEMHLGVRVSGRIPVMVKSEGRWE